jgi:carboxymethylenebutenolidase
MMKARLLWLIPLGLLLFPAAVLAQEPGDMTVNSEDVEVMSGGQAYQSYLAAPSEGGPYPGIVLIHSFNGLEEGYRVMTDRVAAEGFVVLAVGWQTFEQSPSDATMGQLLQDSVAFLSAREDVDAERLGLTGFCAGGRYTMLFLPQMTAFKAGVAWYGFPYRGDTLPADLIGDLAAPLLVIHGSKDEPSPIADIYRYATALDEAGKYFELKVYFGEGHGFMLSSGQLREDEVAQSALAEMVSFFTRKLG